MGHHENTERVDEYMKSKVAPREVCTLKTMSESFAHTAEALKIYITINPSNLQIESIHVGSEEGLARLMTALDTAYVELLGSGLDVDEVLPLVLLTEDYFKALKKAKSRKRGGLN